MDSPKAWLIDVYNTVLHVDFDRVLEGLSDVAGVPANLFGAAFDQVAVDVMTRHGAGQDAMAHVLSSCGVEPDERRVAELVAADQQLMIEHAHVFEDAIDFLHRLRGAGVSTALVSNCSDNTRALLAHFGLDALVDELVLSNEIGFMKPDARIFRFALDRLGVMPGSAAFLDDRLSSCRGAMALGIRAVRIQRDAQPVAPALALGEPQVVTSCAELAPW
jgi:HAD superfamily hydrolase (TIGR01509 family)